MHRVIISPTHPEESTIIPITLSQQAADSDHDHLNENVSALIRLLP